MPEKRNYDSGDCNSKDYNPLTRKVIEKIREGRENFEIRETKISGDEVSTRNFRFSGKKE